MKAKRAVLIHGWNVRDGGAATVDTLKAYLEAMGWTVETDEGDYGFIFWRMLSIFGRMFMTKDIIKRLVPAIAKADLIVAHSNGPNFANRALRLLPDKFKNTKIVVWISPATNKKTEIPEAVKAQLVIYTRHDKAVKAAKYLPFSNWGNQGAVGYQGSDKRNTNFDASEYALDHSWHFHDAETQFKTAKKADDFYQEKAA